MDILIIRSEALGGILVATRIARALREKYYSSRICWLTCFHGAELVSHCTSIDGYSTELLDYQSFYWDIVITPSIGGERDLKYASTIKCKKRIGLCMDENNAVIYDNDSVDFFRVREDKKFRATLGISTEQLCIKKLGLAANSFYDYETTCTEIAYATKELNKLPVPPKHLVGIHYGSSARWDSKALPPETLLSILSELIDNFPNYHFVIFVGPREEESLGHLLVEIERMDNAYIVQNRSLGEIIAIISQIRLIISTDSFIMHAAIAVKTNIVALFGPTSITEIDFFGFGNAITMGLECSPCFAKQKNECTNAINMNCVNNFPIYLITASVNSYIGKRG